MGVTVGRSQGWTKSLSNRVNSAGKMSSLKEICSGLPVNPIPRAPGQRDDSVPHAPVRILKLSQDEELVSFNWHNFLIFFIEHLFCCPSS